MDNAHELALRGAVNALFISTSEIIIALPGRSSNMFGISESSARNIIADEVTVCAEMLITIMKKMQNDGSS